MWRDPSPHEVTINKTETGFGFNIRGQICEGGVLRSINGDLYPPLQHVSAVLEGGAAENAGLFKGDRILAVNGVNVEGAAHKQVVNLIKLSDDTLILNVISVSEEEACKFESTDAESNDSFPTDYSEKRAIPISIPSLQVKNKNGDRYVAYDIVIAGTLMCSKRFSEFVSLNEQLKRTFLGFSFPKVPPKWPFKLTNQQLYSRRRGLESYLEQILAVKIIFESQIVQDWLNRTED